MREQRVVLFLGAGASMGSVTADGRKMPTAKILASDIAARFLSAKFSAKDLMRVSELASSEVGASRFNEWLREYFEGFQPTQAHQMLPKFRWRLIATTNYDLLVERAYEAVSGGLQNLVPRYKDDQPIESMLGQHSFPLEFLKLHGCIEHVLDKDIPLVLTPDSYNSHELNRKNLYRRLEAYSGEYPIVFCGHSLDDLHIRRLIDLAKFDSRPQHYLVSPDLEPEEIAMWAQKRVIAIKAKFDSFIEALEHNLPPLLRVPPKGEEVITQPYRRFFKVLERESDDLAAAFENQMSILYSGMPVDPVSADKFYSGYDQGWGVLQSGFDVHRRASSLLLEYLISSDAGDAQLAILNGPAGFGKSVALKRAAYELATSFGELVIWMEDSGRLRQSVLRELHDLTGRRIYLFVDRAALSVQKIEELLATAKSSKIPLTVVSAERRNEWHMFCQRLQRFSPTMFEVARLSEREVTELLEKLEQFGCLGALASLSVNDRRERILKRLDRQLLVALHEATRGRPFEDIVLDEYHRVSPVDAQQLYLDICTLHRFDVPVRAGAISRISSISFRDFEGEFFEPLEDLVLTSRNSVTGDWEYRARHALVSEIVFERACATDEDRSDQIQRLIDCLDTSFRSDELALSQLAKGKALADSFENAIFGREIFDLASARNPRHAFIHQQRAIFEYTHRDGDLKLAEQHAIAAINIDNDNPTLKHTFATVLRRQALATSSDFARQSHRAHARKVLSTIQDQTNAYVLGGRARLRVDEVADALERFRRRPEQVYELELTEAIEDAELALHRAFNMYPDDPDFLEAKARMTELLGNLDQSTALLRKAFSRSSKGSGIAKRLARRYIETGEPDAAYSLLKEAAEKDPTQRSIQLFLANARFEVARDIHDPAAVGHLERSHVNGDREHYSRFIEGVYRFVTKNYSEALRLLGDVEKRAPADPKIGGLERRWLSSHLTGWRGKVIKNYGGYAFVTVQDCPKDIFAPVQSSSDDEWDKIRNV